MRRAAPLALALVLATSAGCSDDDEEPAAATSAAPGALVATSVAPPAPTAAPTTVPPPASLDDLAAGLLADADVGVPATWAIRDLDPAVMDAEMATLADPLQGLVTCPDGAIRPADGWLQRTFSGADPLADGMLRVDLVLAVEDAAAFATRRAALDGCTSGGESSLERSTATVAGTEATVLVLSAGPTADVPYPSSYALVAANVDGRSVTAVVGGVDLGVPFADTTRELVGRVLARL